MVPEMGVTGAPQTVQVEEKPLAVGDICLLHIQRGKHQVVNYKYCRVEETILSKDGLVQTVVVLYLNVPSKRKKHTTVDVRRLSLICHPTKTAEDGLGLTAAVI